MSTLIYRDAFGKALQDSMREEPKLMIIGQNLTGHALKALAETYGTERVRDCSISESAMVGMAVGAAMKGMKVVVMIAYADIASVCHMAIVQSAAKLHYMTNGRLNCPVIIRLPIARFRGHGPEGNEVGVSWFFNVPDLNIAMPGSSSEAYWNFREALTTTDADVVLRRSIDSSTLGRIGGAQSRRQSASDPGRGSSDYYRRRTGGRARRRCRRRVGEARPYGIGRSGQSWIHQTAR